MGNRGERVTIQKEDMPGYMKNDAIGVALRAVDIYGSNQDSKIATYIREVFDSKYENYWQCFIGRKYVPAWSISHDSNFCIEFTIDHYHILLFRTKEPKNGDLANLSVV